ncbi:hypothetical protein MLD38_015779 [Melastoma candidum]|uniref:Uncharacterized protein n=1 Tax=Melastoma candidum TaxID=119954 RepID=A0ACB9RHA8_9MYRT|nr:hypothetical protein MLD38_015779 [Melastoma candidum]
MTPRRRAMGPVPHLRCRRGPPWRQLQCLHRPRFPGFLPKSSGLGCFLELCASRVAVLSHRNLTVVQSSHGGCLRPSNLGMTPEEHCIFIISTGQLVPSQVNCLVVNRLRRSWRFYQDLSFCIAYDGSMVESREDLNKMVGMLLFRTLLTT